MRFSHAVASLAFFLSSVVAGAPALAQNVDGLNAGGSDSSSNEETNINTGSESHVDGVGNWEHSVNKTFNNDHGGNLVTDILKRLGWATNRAPGLSSQPGAKSKLCKKVIVRGTEQTTFSIPFFSSAKSSVAALQPEQRAQIIQCLQEDPSILRIFAQGGSSQDYVLTAGLIVSQFGGQMNDSVYDRVEELSYIRLTEDRAEEKAYLAEEVFTWYITFRRQQAQ